VAAEINKSGGYRVTTRGPSQFTFLSNFITGRSGFVCPSDFAITMRARRSLCVCFRVCVRLRGVTLLQHIHLICPFSLRRLCAARGMKLLSKYYHPRTASIRRVLRRLPFDQPATSIDAPPRWTLGNCVCER
jgi:hypothetical protein